MNNFIRISKYKPNEVLPYIYRDLGKNSKERLADPRAYKVYSGKKVWMGRRRYKVFLESIICCVCSLEGQFFALEQQADQDSKKHWYFNLYGLNSDGEEVFFTQDHILPKSRGGSNNLANLQTMCAPCNTAKGNSLPDPAKSPRINSLALSVDVTRKEAEWVHQHLTEISDANPGNIHAARLALKFSNLLRNHGLSKHLIRWGKARFTSRNGHV